MPLPLRARAGPHLPPAKWWTGYPGVVPCTNCTHCAPPPPPVTCDAVGAARASCWAGEWGVGANPARVPSAETTDGPLLGDGETGVVFGVEAPSGRLTGYLSANSFWELNKDTFGHTGRSSNHGLGGVTLALANASTAGPPRFALEQSLATGTVSFSVWSPDESSVAPLLTGVSVLSQGEGGDSTGEGGAPSTLVTTLVGGEGVDVSWTTWAFNSTDGAGVSGSAAGGAAFATRALLGTARPVTAAIVSRLRAAEERGVPGGSEAAACLAAGQVGTALRFSLAPGATVTVVTTVLSSVTTGAAPSATLALAVQANAVADADATAAQAAAYWHAFWARSSVTLPAQWATVERYWYGAQYLLGMSSRRGRVAPAIWGYGTFQLNFHRFDRFELDLRGRTQP